MEGMGFFLREGLHVLGKTFWFTALCGLDFAAWAREESMLEGRTGGVRVHSREGRGYRSGFTRTIDAPCIFTRWSPRGGGAALLHVPTLRICAGESRWGCMRSVCWALLVTFFPVRLVGGGLDSNSVCVPSIAACLGHVCTHLGCVRSIWPYRPTVVASSASPNS